MQPTLFASRGRGWTDILILPKKVEKTEKNEQIEGLTCRILPRLCEKKGET